MVKIIVEHKVKDFDSWRPVYESSLDFVTKSGGKNMEVSLLHGTTNDVYVTGDFDNEKNLRTFLDSKELKDKMKESGVISEPQVTILEEKARG